MQLLRWPRKFSGTLSGKRVLVVGAGEMGEGVAGALSRAGTESITVLNRTAARAEALAEKLVLEFLNLKVSKQN